MRDVEKLLDWLSGQHARPMRWGRNDCASFAATAIRKQTGRDVRGKVRWHSAREAAAVIEAEGGLEAAVNRRLTPIAPAMAQRGDIAGVPDDRFGIRLMIVEGRTLVGPGANGLERQPRGVMTLAWTIEQVG